MSTPKHTPGPWAYKECTNGYAIDSVVPNAAGYYIGDVHKTTNPEHDLIDEANAQLIAAAPELLSALDFCLIVLEETASINGAHAAIKIARAAIDKATGGAE